MPLFRGVSVLLDQQPPERGALAHAMEWAGRLRLPLRPVAPATFDPPAYDAITRAARCLFQPHELCVFGSFPASVRRGLLETSLRAPQTAVLTTTAEKAVAHVSRVLILNHRRQPGDGFLASAAALCRAFAAAPVILTVASTAPEGRARERTAADSLAKLGVAADCDLAGGCDLPTAVARAARWRRCSHVLVERAAPAWPRWLGGDVLRDLAGLSDALTLVAVPAAAAIEPDGTDNIPAAGASR